MQIYLLRHAIAEDPRPGMPDADRALTGEGVKKLREIVKRAKAAGVSPSRILSSPLKRAIETAAIAAKLLEHNGDVVLSRLLVPTSMPQETWDEVRTFKGETSILLVGHEPAMSQLTAFLLGVPELQMDFKKGAMVRIDLPAMNRVPRGTLKWMMAPKLAS